MRVVGGIACRFDVVDSRFDLVKSRRARYTLAQSFFAVVPGLPKPAGFEFPISLTSADAGVSRVVPFFSRVVRNLDREVILGTLPQWVPFRRTGESPCSNHLREPSIQ
jgi:hypothetical protein